MSDLESYSSDNDNNYNNDSDNDDEYESNNNQDSVNQYSSNVYPNLRCYYLSRINMIKTLILRGYEISDLHNELLNQSYKDFYELYKNRSCKDVKVILSNSMKFNSSYNKNIKENSDSKKKKLPKIFVLWIPERNLGYNIKFVCEQMKEEKYKSCIVIPDYAVTPHAVKTIKNIKDTFKLAIDYWTLKESMIYVPDHILVPKQRILSKEEAEELLKIYNIEIKSKKIPRIHTTDTMVKYLGAKKGNIIEIRDKCDGETDNEYITYRMVY